MTPRRYAGMRRAIRVVDELAARADAHADAPQRAALAAARAEFRRHATRAIGTGDLRALPRGAPAGADWRRAVRKVWTYLRAAGLHAEAVAGAGGALHHLATTLGAIAALPRMLPSASPVPATPPRLVPGRAPCGDLAPAPRIAAGAGLEVEPNP
jgi:hypothetical protein